VGKIHSPGATVSLWWIQYDDGSVKEVSLQEYIEWKRSGSAVKIISQVFINEHGELPYEPGTPCEGCLLVSTVFLPVDHSFGSGSPVLWETMIFGSSHFLDQECWRYTSRQAAVDGHAEAVRLAKVAMSEAGRAAYALGGLDALAALANAPLQKVR